MSLPRPREGTPIPERTLSDDVLVDAERDDSAVPQASPARRPLWTALGIVAVAFNLRPALSSIAPILRDIQAGTGLGAAGAGILTTAPVLCLGLVGPLAPRLARLSNAESVVALFVIVLAGGIVLRGADGVVGLFAGTILAGAGIGVINVLIPGLIKRDFPHHAPMMTGVYTMVLCVGAAAGAGLTVPLGRTLGLGWGGTLMLWSLPAVLALAVWLPQIWGASGRHLTSSRGGELARLLRDRLAWQVTGFMGFQSSLAYIVFGWLPVILSDRGLSAEAGGWMSSASVMVQTTTALAVPMLAGRMRDQRAIVAAVMAAAATGLCGVMLGPVSILWLSAVVLGLGLGGSFSIAITLIVLRSKTAQDAAQLSGMAQSMGYTLAATGPFGVGLAHDWSHGWAVPLAICLVLAGTALACGLGAGREGHVLAES